MKLFSGDYGVKYGLYGISDHFKARSDGQTYTEVNYGLSLIKPIDWVGNGLSQTELELGAYRNSFDDLAAWIGIGIYIPINEGFELGVNALHWETMRGTYAHQPIVLYPVIRTYLTKKLAIKTRFSTSSVVASFEIEFD